MIRSSILISTVTAFLLLIPSVLRLRAPGSRPELSRALYQDPSVPVAKRVDDLVSRMTLEEKVLQMQHTAPAIPRLSIPSYDWWNEALHGVARSGYATVFPQAIGMAATWDTDLIHREAQVISTEARAKYNQAQREDNHSIYYGLTFWSPNINIFRDPRWGRGQETYGEDPFLASKLGVAFVTGLQGDDPKYFKVIATPKHYAVHSGPESERHGFNVNASPHDLEDTYLPAFRATVVEGQADSSMCAYNAVDGEPACANTYLLQRTLRDAWKFQGYVTSDCGAVQDITTGHKFTPDNEHGSAAAVRAGTDTTCGNEYVALVQAVRDGLIKESEIDTAVTRLFTARMRLGMFDPQDSVSYNQVPMSDVDSAEHRQLALQVARESMVLLKNRNGVLPLKAGIKKIAVIGPNAESLASLEGNYNGTPSAPVLPLSGLHKRFAGEAEVLYAQGSAYVSELPVPVPRTVFHPAEGQSSYGLKAQYFANTDFSGEPVLTRVDPQIQFDWNATSPVPGVPLKAFSVRWSGTLTPPGPGDYTFGIEETHCYPCGDHETYRVYVDGKLMNESIVSRDGGRSVLQPFQIHFTDTKPHAFRLDYTHQAPLFAAGATLTWRPPAVALRQEAVDVARQTDVVVAFVGLSPNLEGEEMPIHVEGFSGGDRTDIGLPRIQQDLLEALAATGKPLVVVLMNGSALAATWADEHADAILEAWYPGEEGGTAIAETLAGDNNPGGRLPLTFYASLDQLPPFDDYSMRNRTYRYFSGRPLYRFGYGLSYADFAYSNLKLSSTRLQAGESLTVETDVRNTANIAGDEVVELYLVCPAGRVCFAPPTGPSSPTLLRELRGFTRVRLAPGETRHVAFVLTPRDLSQVTEQGEHIVLPGNFAVMVGSSLAEGSQVTAEFDIAGSQVLPR